MRRPNPDTMSVTDAYRRFCRLQELGYPREEVEELLQACERKGEEFLRAVRLRVTLALNPPIELLHELDRNLFDP